MEDLLKLIEITKKRGQRSIQLVNLNFRKNEVSKDNQLYDGIVNGQFFSDDEAAKAMFRSHPGNRNYRNAKAKLKQKLLNHLYFLDYDKSSYTLYNKCEYESRHLLHQCQILVNEGAHDIAANILPQLIKNAKQFECIDILISALVMQRNDFARQGKVTPYQEVCEEITYYQGFKSAIEEAEAAYQGILVFVNKSVSAQNRVMSNIPETVIKLQKYAVKYKSRQIDRLVFLLQTLFNELSWNFKENIKLCDAIEERYLKKDNSFIEVDLNKNDVVLTKLKAYYSLRDAEEGGAYAQKTSKFFKVGSGPWFRFMELHFLLMMKGQQYKKGGEIFRKVRTNKNYNLLPDLDKKRWKIYRAFLVFVNDSKLLRWGFDLEKFVDTMPNYPKEYASYNVARLIIQYMYLLRDGRIDEVRQRIDALQQYNSTHLDKRHNYRNSIFIRLLTIITEKEFNYEQIEEKGRTYYSKLRKIDIPSEPGVEMEVISYDVLYGFILEYLKSNKLYVHYRFYNLNAV